MIKPELEVGSVRSKFFRRFFYCLEKHEICFMLLFALLCDINAVLYQSSSSEFIFILLVGV